MLFDDYVCAPPRKQRQKNIGTVWTRALRRFGIEQTKWPWSSCVALRNSSPNHRDCKHKDQLHSNTAFSKCVHMENKTQTNQPTNQTTNQPTNQPTKQTYNLNKHSGHRTSKQTINQNKQASASTRTISTEGSPSSRHVFTARQRERLARGFLKKQTPRRSANLM